VCDRSLILLLHMFFLHFKLQYPVVDHDPAYAAVKQSNA
jgi:hypothetical protein